MNEPDDYIDEDRALGFNVWVAELELLVGQAKGRTMDQVAAFELLQKVWVTITPAHVDRIKEYQRRAETCLLEIILRGASSPVRRLVGLCIAALYEVGDSLPMFARVGDLRALLAAKDAKSLSDSTKMGVLQCLAILCWKHGRRLASSMSEIMAIALKYSSRGLDLGVRLAACDCITNVVSGLGPSDRSSLTIQTDAYKCAIKLARESGDSSSHRIQLAATKILRSVCQSEGIPIWANAYSFDEILKLCISQLENENQALAEAFASILGELTFAAKSEAAENAVKLLEKKTRQKAALEHVLKSCFTTCLVTPFVAAANQRKTRTCLVLVTAWLSYLNHVQESSQGNDKALIEVAGKLLEMLGKVEPQHLPNDETELGSFLASGELPHAQACILYVLRAGVIERLGETGQREMVEKLTVLLASQLGSHVAAAITTLGALGLLLEILGEIHADEMPSIENAVGEKLIHSSSPLRRQAAAVLAAIATAEPSSASRLIQERLNSLVNSVNRMASVCGVEPTNLHQGPQLFGDKISVSRSATGTQESQEGHLSGTPRGMVAKEAGVVKPTMDVVHGNALAVAALLVAASRLPLGIPSKLHTEAFKVCEQLIEKPVSKRAAGRAVEREAGYTILGSLFVAFPPDMLQDKELEMFQLLQTALAPESVADLDLRKYLTVSLATAEVTMSTELWWRGAALEAVKAVFLSNLTADAKKMVRLQRRLAVMLEPALTLLLSSPVLQDPQRTKGVLGGASASFQMRLLEAYLAFPDPNSFQAEHQNLSKLCMRAFRASSVLTSAQQGIATSAATSTLRQLLNKSDSSLGPWQVGKGPLEDSLQAFNGAPGGPMYHPWEAGLPFSLGYSGKGARGPNNHFCQPSSLSASLLERQLELLGSLLAVVEEANQVQILDVMLVASKGPPSKPGLKESPLWRHAILVTICSTALAGLDSLARRFRGMADSRDGVAARAKALAEAALEEGSSSMDTALLRSSAEMFALAACIGSDKNAVQLLIDLCRELASTSNTARRMTHALALGCVYRSKGGMALQATVAQVSQTLLAVARISGGTTSLWLTHALILVANATGLSFIPHVKGVLQFLVGIAMTEEPRYVPGLRPAIGQLSNAVVAVLGPELKLGSSAYTTTRALINDLQFSQDDASIGEEATMLELERVLYIQMLILFAPHAVPAIAHLHLLLTTLNSRQPALRRTAADTLRHLSERDAEPILPSKIESLLFSALDRETDVGTAAQLQGTISTLLAACADSQPAHYLSTCSTVILAASNTTTAEPFSEIVYDADLGNEEDDEAEAGIQERRESGGAASTSQPVAAVPKGMQLTSRIRTRVYAADCLLLLLPQVAHDSRHFDLAAAQAAQGGDWLVKHLQELIDLAFKMSTGSVEAIRPAGLKLLTEILRYFGNLKDPLLEGARLLEQFQAQYVTALRAALSPSASPSLVSSGAVLSADFMKSGLAMNDRALLSKLIGMMTGPLAPNDAQQQELYAEWVGIGAKIALLEANAICLVYLLTDEANSLQAVREMMESVSPRYLVQQWIYLIQEWIVLATQSAETLASYTPKLFATPAPAIYATIQAHLTRAWSPSLAAASLVISKLPQESDEEEEAVSTDDYKMLLGACYWALVSTATPETQSRIPAADLHVVLSSLTHLLGPAFLPHFDVILLRDILTALTANVKQDVMSETGRAAAAQCMLQICTTSPSGYLFSKDLLQSLLSALLALLDPDRVAESEEEGFRAFSETVTSSATTMRAGAVLASKAQGPLAMPVLVKLVLQTMTYADSDAQGSCVEAACDLLLEAAKTASKKFDSAGDFPVESNGLAVHSSLLIHIATLCSDTLLSADSEQNPAESSRVAVLLDFLLSLGGLLPALPSDHQLPDLQILKPEEASASPLLDSGSEGGPADDAIALEEDDSADRPEPNRAESVGSDDWGSEEEMVAAESADENDWADAAFAEASEEAVPEHQDTPPEIADSGAALDPSASDSQLVSGLPSALSSDEEELAPEGEGLAGPPELLPQQEDLTDSHSESSSHLPYALGSSDLQAGQTLEQEPFDAFAAEEDPPSSLTREPEDSKQSTTPSSGALSTLPVPQERGSVAAAPSTTGEDTEQDGFATFDTPEFLERSHSDKLEHSNDQPDGVQSVLIHTDATQDEAGSSTAAAPAKPMNAGWSSASNGEPETLSNGADGSSHEEVAAVVVPLEHPADTKPPPGTSESDQILASESKASREETEGAGPASRDEQAVETARPLDASPLAVTPSKETPAASEPIEEPPSEQQPQQGLTGLSKIPMAEPPLSSLAGDEEASQDHQTSSKASSENSATSREERASDQPAVKTSSSMSESRAMSGAGADAQAAGNDAPGVAVPTESTSAAAEPKVKSDENDQESQSRPEQPVSQDSQSRPEQPVSAAKGPVIGALDSSLPLYHPTHNGQPSVEDQEENLTATGAPSSRTRAKQQSTSLPGKQPSGVSSLLARFETPSSPSSAPQQSFRHLLKPRAPKEDPPWLKSPKEDPPWLRSPKESPPPKGSENSLAEGHTVGERVSGASSRFQAARNMFAERSSSLRNSKDLDDDAKPSEHLNLRGGGDEPGEPHGNSVAGSEDYDDWSEDDFVAAESPHSSDNGGIAEGADEDVGQPRPEKLDVADVQRETDTSEPVNQPDDSGTSHPIPEELSKARNAMLQALGARFAQVDAALQLQLMEKLQKLSGEAGGNKRASAWVLSCSSVIIPQAIEQALPWLAVKDAQLTEEQSVVAGKLLSLIVSSLSPAQKHDNGLMAHLLGYLVDLMVLIARKDSNKAAQGLRELSRKLMTALAGGGYGAEFKTALLSLAPDARQALQALLQAEHQAPAGVVQNRTSAKAPSIALKTFAAFKPPTAKKPPSPPPSLSDDESEE